MDADLKSRLKDGLQQMGLAPDAGQQLLLLEYVALLTKWNSTYNLTALRTPEQMIHHHLLDSLTLLPYINGVKTLMDVGSGGGMPGIPTAICRPDLHITLLDSNTKKTAFLQQAVIELGLPNVTVASGRVETMHDKKVDVVTSRAFAQLDDFIALTRHLLGENGYWAAMKGVYPYEELAHVPADVDVFQIERLDVPGLAAERHMVLMRPKRGN
ncbi:16S rRNA (guanine(527)-N(7))-methyltransferase RsmG [Conchiformibius steedae DSM 2580]|uniref:Ribosomal RNA small subunit methyltransferase G n=2 Tax=Conchiformibius steedae TaxID=153493 RepID=A0A3P2A6U1_9NEIS|nr:16S rRNA (guanine(527)-N(7))-methyltransferase RsmG [Conchiformibius steedae]QMT32757.1 16S rRNA (guanine(527)-N(7))-methyltransferase RsmG [Conchiformibius steedae]RRD91129.1 16S rRNA (guanine(527)-N(7))-methyltransferase RsmG [Conchiformibius steedae]URD67368.1 16S rRNA (guanine(527)-N(7))-methyltransferase RsmG [Conchiformibius steedae DSM 2580]